MKLLLAFLLLTQTAFGLYEIGDHPKNSCWEALRVGKYCFDDAKKDDHATVMLFSAGWCGPCHNEFKELVPALEKFAGKKVTFVSLSCGSRDSSKDPDDNFLKWWDAMYGISTKKAHWIVASNPRDCGRYYFTSPSIPSVVITDKKGKVAYKGTAPGVKEIIRQVERVL